MAEENTGKRGSEMFDRICVDVFRAANHCALKNGRNERSALPHLLRKCDSVPDSS